MSNEEDYGLVVGITDYAKFDTVPSAEEDAQAFAKWLREPDGGGVSEDNVKVVVSSDQPRLSGRKVEYPWKDHVDDKLKEIIGDRTGRIGRRFYLYFSGHGCLESLEKDRAFDG